MKNEVLSNIGSRRSTRKYLKKPLEKEILSEIIEAGRLAPSGMNRQSTHLLVFSTEKALSDLAEALKDVKMSPPPPSKSQSAPPPGSPPPSGDMMKRDGSKVDIGYGAPVFIIVANKKDAHNAMADSSCVMENMMLAAASLGVGSCWVNQFSMFETDPVVRSYLESVGLKEDEKICAALALGYAEKLETEPLPRTGNPVTYIE